jgi:hypothetical protein
MSELLETASADAEMLLMHAMRDGVSVPKPIIDEIVRTRTLLAGRVINDEQKAAFWNAFGELAKLVAPVTVSSLRATTDSNTPSHSRLIALLQRIGLADSCSSLARSAVVGYTLMTLGTIVVLLALQIYWLFGLTITADIHAFKAELLANKKTITTTTLARDQARANNSAVAEFEFELKQLDEKDRNIEVGKESSFNMLKSWSAPWDGNWSISKSCSLGNDLAADERAQEQCVRNTRLQAAGVVLENLQRYALPLIYGLLGACVFTLRTLANLIRSRAYSESNNIDFRIRLCLGTLGGLVSAWFLIPGKPGSGESLTGALSPFALAFLAGYSIELVFAAMDRMISAFTKPGQA